MSPARSEELIGYMNNQIDIDKQRTRLSVTLKTISTTNMLELEDRIARWMDENEPALKTVGASPTVMFSHIGMRNIVSMLTGTAFALIAISLILVLFFKSLLRWVIFQDGTPHQLLCYRLGSRSIELKPLEKVRIRT